MVVQQLRFWVWECCLLAPTAVAAAVVATTTDGVGSGCRALAVAFPIKIKVFERICACRGKSL